MARKNEPYIYQVLRRETPNPRQQAFFRAKAANVAYGGARGGGKSWAVRTKAVLLALRYPGIRLLLVRRRQELGHAAQARAAGDALPGAEAPAAAPDAAGAAR